MLSIAEKIKLKLQDLEQYNVDEVEEKSDNNIDSEDDSKSDIEVVNEEKFRRKSMDVPEPKQEFLQNYLIEKKIEIHENSQSCKNLEIENKNDISIKIISEKDINYKINECVYNKLNRNNMISTIKNSNNKIKQNKKVSFPTTSNKNYPVNFQTNYSTDHTQSIDGNAKHYNFNYVELGNTNEDNFYYDENFLNSENNNNINYTKLQYKNDINPSIENPSIHNNLVKDYNKAFTLAPNFHSEDSDECNDENVKEYFNVINLDDREKLDYRKINEKNINNFEYNKVMIESTKKDKKISWKFTTFIYFLEELLYCIMMVFLLILNPLIILILKLIDFIKEKLKNYNENKNLKQAESNNEQFDYQIGKSHLLYCGDIDEIEYDNIENLNNFNRILGYYERYDNFFFNNCEYRRYRKIIKISFIVFSLFFDFIILTNIEDKNFKLLMFFINNLYLLYHTLDFYNEKLFGNYENFNLYAD